MKIQKSNEHTYIIRHEYCTEYGKERSATFVYDIDKRELQLFEGEFDDATELNKVKTDIADFMNQLEP